MVSIVNRVITERGIVRTRPTGDTWDVMAAPIAAHDIAYGAIVIGVAAPAAFAADDEDVVAVIGRQAGLAVHVERLGADLHATRQQVLEAGKVSALGQLVAGVAHDLNNPLTSVMGYAQLVQQQVRARGNTGPRWKHVQEDVAHILVEAENAARILRNLLLFARRQQPVRAQHDLSFLCSQVLDLRAHDLRVNGVEVTVEFAPDFPLVLVDASQIRHVLLNLILNAEHALDARPTRRLAIRGTTDGGSGTVRLEIEDTGHGIEPAIRRRVFNPFFTTRPPGVGTGLGLSIVSGIVRDHGGDVWVESEPTQGTRFIIRLPTGAADATRTRHREARQR